MKKVCEDINYCIVIPFATEEDFRDAIEKVQDTRPNIQVGWKQKWWTDGLIIDKKDYEKLFKKSKSIEIVNELENGDKKN